jgi:hypothetical protein
MPPDKNRLHPIAVIKLVYPACQHSFNEKYGKGSTYQRWYIHATYGSFSRCRSHKKSIGSRRRGVDCGGRIGRPRLREDLSFLLVLTRPAERGDISICLSGPSQSQSLCPKPGYRVSNDSGSYSLSRLHLQLKPSVYTTRHRTKTL